MLDIVIRGGTLIDGTGAPSRQADIGIREGRIVTVGEVTEEAERNSMPAVSLLLLDSLTRTLTMTPSCCGIPPLARQAFTGSPPSWAVTVALHWRRCCLGMLIISAR